MKMKTTLLTSAILLSAIISVQAQLDWEDVEIANFESEITHLEKKGMVTSKAKGVTVYSSQGKMQTRAINKLKMTAAMMGANTVLLLDQQTQSAQYGGYYGSSTTPSANNSGIAYTDIKVDQEQIEEGIYIPMEAYYLGPNHTSLQKAQNSDIKRQVAIRQSNIKQDKNGLELRQIFEVSGKYASSEWEIVRLEEDRIFLYSVYRTNGGKETHMAIILHIIGNL